MEAAEFRIKCSGEPVEKEHVRLRVWYLGDHSGACAEWIIAVTMEEMRKPVGAKIHI